ncbi:MAG: c-type cytochrome, partial [Burkholderiales bacterium]
LTAALALAAAHALAEQGEKKVVDGEKKAKQVCAACHGENGNKSLTPDTPKLGGQPADYLAKALRDYKSGVRKNPVMGAMATALSAEEIEALAAYFSRQTSELKYVY